MSKNSNSLEKIGENAIKEFGQDLANQLNDLDIPNKAKEGINNALDKVGKGIDSLIDKGEKLGKEAFEKVEDNLKKNINALPIPEKTKEMVIETGTKIIGQVQTFAKNTIDNTKIAVAETKTFAQECVKQCCKVLKSIFTNIGKMIGGKQAPTVALDKVKTDCKVAGEAISKSAQKLKATFVEKFGGKKEVDGKSHAEKVKASKSTGQSKGI